MAYVADPEILGEYEGGVAAELATREPALLQLAHETDQRGRGDARFESGQAVLAQVMAGECGAQLGRGDELVPVVQAGRHEGGHSPVLGQLDRDELAEPGPVDRVEQEQPSWLEHPGYLACDGVDVRYVLQTSTQEAMSAQASSAGRCSPGPIR
jgi:hypothetical protein